MGDKSMQNDAHALVMLRPLAFFIDQWLNILTRYGKLMNKHQIMRPKRIQEDTNANAIIESLSIVA